MTAPLPVASNCRRRHPRTRAPASPWRLVSSQRSVHTPFVIQRYLFKTLLALVILASPAIAQDKKSKAPGKKKPSAPFSWARSTKSADALPVQHGSFKSPSMDLDVGYYIYLPPGYSDAANADKRYPVVYHLHGGRPGGEAKSISLSTFVDAAIKAGTIEPTIYVFPNGGPMSWYNYPQIENASGEDVFINETIPHIDATYRTNAERGSRGLEGFSQGGRGATRIMFKHPQLFGSVAPGGSGYEPEKHIQENDGVESEKVVFAPGYNTWDLAKKFADRRDKPELPILLWVGNKGFNYEFNLKFSAYLKELGIDHDIIVCDDAPHSARIIYEKRGDELMQFHQKNFRAALK